MYGKQAATDAPENDDDSEKNKKEDKKEKEEKPPTVSLLQLVNIVLKRALSSHHPTSSCTLH